MFPIVVENLAEARLHRGRARHRREAVRPRPRVGARAERDPAPGLPRGVASSASTTTSARRRSRTSSTSASPTRSSSRSGTATTSRTCRSRWRRASASQGRGKFYEETGAIRDVIQNHLLQVVELPGHGGAVVSTYAEAIRDEQAKVLRDDAAARAPTNMVRGQFRGYRDEPGVRQDSYVATYAALRLYVDSWRWEGVPFYVRAGKCLATTVTEVMVELKNAAAGGLQRGRARRRATTCASGLSPRWRSRSARGPSGRARAWRASRSSCRSSMHDTEADGGHRVERTSGCSATPWPATRRCSRARTWSRRPGPSSIRCSTAPSPHIEYEPGNWGPPEADALARTSAAGTPRHERGRALHPALSRPPRCHAALGREPLRRRHRRRSLRRRPRARSSASPRACTDHSFAAVYTSPLDRTVETARILARPHALEFRSATACAKSATATGKD